MTVGAPCLLLGGFPAPGRSSLAWLGLLCIVIGASIYLSCAWEFAVRGLGTPAPIAPTKLRQRLAPLCVQSDVYRRVARGHGRICPVSCSSAHCLCGVPLLDGLSLCIFYEEPTLHRQFGTAYDEYRRAVPGWIPRFRK